MWQTGERQGAGSERAGKARLGGIHSSPFYTTSAKTGEGVEDSFRALASAIAERHDGDL